MADLADLTTPRLLLRPMRHRDLPAFAAMNADPQVMAYFPAPLGRAESEAMAQRMTDHAREHGFGFWAVELADRAAFAGIAGLLVPRFRAHFTPCVEIGWRFAREYWGLGYATEAARAMLDVAFARLGLEEVVSLTVPANERSRRVMERIGMTHNPADDFDHPDLPEGHPLRRHVLYRLSRPAWSAAGHDAV